MSSASNKAASQKDGNSVYEFLRNTLRQDIGWSGKCCSIEAAENATNWRFNPA